MKKMFFNSCKCAILGLIVVLLFGTQTAKCQKHPPYPIPGDTIENHKFYDVVNFPEGKRELKDFRGKWLLLDVWGYSCGSCIKSFPKMDTLRKKLGDKLEIIMVGATKPRGGNWKVAEIEKISKNLYTRLFNEYHLSIPTAFDSLFYTKYGVSALPQILIIDPSGVLKAKVIDVDLASISNYMAGGQVSFRRSYSYEESILGQERNLKIPFLTSGSFANGGMDTAFIYRSLLSYASEKTIYRRVDLYEENLNGRNESFKNTGCLEVLNSELSGLYRIAFLGKNKWTSADSIAYGNFWPNVICESGDDKFLSEKYSFSLSIPPTKATRADIMKTMQTELYNFFGISAKLEKREMPVYVLKVVDRGKADSFIRQKNPALHDAYVGKGVSVWDKPFSEFVVRIAPSLRLKFPLIDRTGLTGLARINFSADLFFKDSIVAALRNNGFELSEEKKQMQVIVIRK